MKKSPIHTAFESCLSILLIAGIIIGTLQLNAAETPTTITWDALISEDYSLDAKMAEYQKQMEEFEEDDPEAEIFYRQILVELSDAPVNQKIDKKWIKLAGFIAPLHYDYDLVTEFLFVPYFGACIHVPPQPVNQVVLVKTASGHAIPLEEAFIPIWVSGQIRVEGEKTEIGEAGYRIEDATIEPYVGK